MNAVAFKPSLRMTLKMQAHFLILAAFRASPRGFFRISHEPAAELSPIRSPYFRAIQFIAIRPTASSNILDGSGTSHVSTC